MNKTSIKYKKHILHLSKTYQTNKGWSELKTSLTPVFLKECSAFLERELNVKKRGLKSFEFSVTLCGKKRIQSLNKNYRNKDKVTDVLSFQMDTGWRSKKKKLNVCENLGDIFICREVAKAQAKKFNLSYNQEVIYLAIHGFLHLCGFDHEINKKEEKIMELFEKKLSSRIL